MEETKIVEINGIKMEVDLRTAKMQRIDTFKIGDHVKLLKQESYGSPVVQQGVITSFDDFKSLPTICVLYIDHSEIKHAFVNSNSKHEIIACEPHDLTANKDWIMKKMDDAVTSAELSLAEKKRNRELFLSQFGKYFRIEEDESKAAEK